MALRVVREGEAQPQSEEVVAHGSIALASLTGMYRSLYQQFGPDFLNFAAAMNAPVSSPIEAVPAPQNEQVQTSPNNVIQFPLPGSTEPTLGGFAVNESGVESDAPSNVQPLGAIAPIGEFPGIEPPQMAA